MCENVVTISFINSGMVASMPGTAIGTASFSAISISVSISSG